MFSDGWEFLLLVKRNCANWNSTFPLCYVRGSYPFVLWILVQHSLLPLVNQHPSFCQWSRQAFPVYICIWLFIRGRSSTWTNRNTCNSLPNRLLSSYRAEAEGTEELTMRLKFLREWAMVGWGKTRRRHQHSKVYPDSPTKSVATIGSTQNLCLISDLWRMAVETPAAFNCHTFLFVRRPCPWINFRAVEIFRWRG